MSDIFISYSREDKSKAKQLAEALESLGWSVWWDRIIPAGRTFDEVIEEAIINSRSVIVLWSSHSVSSRWVKLEAQEGLDRQVLIPCKIEDVQIPFAFRNIQAANLTNWNGDKNTQEFRDLVRDLRSVLETGNMQIEDGVKEEDSVGARFTLQAEHQGNADEEQNSDPETRAMPQRPVRSQEVSNSGSKKVPHFTKRKAFIAAIVIVVLVVAAYSVWVINKNNSMAKLMMEEKAWGKADSINSIEAFQKYLSDFPDGAHRKEVQKQLEHQQNRDLLRDFWKPDGANTDYENEARLKDWMRVNMIDTSPGSITMFIYGKEYNELRAKAVTDLNLK